MNSDSKSRALRRARRGVKLSPARGGGFPCSLVASFGVVTDPRFFRFSQQSESIELMLGYENSPVMIQIGELVQPILCSIVRRTWLGHPEA